MPETMGDITLKALQMQLRKRLSEYQESSKDMTSVVFILTTQHGPAIVESGGITPATVASGGITPAKLASGGITLARPRATKAT